MRPNPTSKTECRQGIPSHLSYQRHNVKHNFRIINSCSPVEKSATLYGRARFVFLQPSGRNHTAGIFMLQIVEPGTRWTQEFCV